MAWRHILHIVTAKWFGVNQYDKSPTKWTPLRKRIVELWVSVTVFVRTEVREGKKPETGPNADFCLKPESPIFMQNTD